MTFQTILMKSFSSPPSFADHDAMAANFFGCRVNGMEEVGQLLAAEAASFHLNNRRPFVGQEVKALKDGEIQAFSGTLKDGKVGTDTVKNAKPPTESKKMVRFAAPAKDDKSDETSNNSSV